MIVDRDTRPDKSIYFLGGKTIETMRDSQFGVLSPLELYSGVNDILENKISFDYFLLTLDWLFVLGLVETNENGDIVKCF